MGGGLAAPLTFSELGAATAGLTVGLLLDLIGSGLLTNPTSAYDGLAISIPGAPSEAAFSDVHFDGATLSFYHPAWMLNGSRGSSGGPVLYFVAHEPSGVSLSDWVGCAAMTPGMRSWYSPDSAIGIEHDCNLSHVTLLVHAS